MKLYANVEKGNQVFKNISEWFFRLSKGWVAAAGLLIFLTFSMTVLPSQSALAESYSAGSGVPDTSLFYSPEDLYRMANSYGAAGRQAYVQARFSFDLVFPLIYTFFLTTSTSWLLKHSLKKASAWRFLNLLPLTAMILDFLENICTASVIGAYPAHKPMMAFLAAVFTPLKWLLVGASFLSMIIAGAAAFLRLIQTSQK